MRTSPERRWRRNFRAAAAACLIVTLAPSLRAQSAEPCSETADSADARLPGSVLADSALAMRMEAADDAPPPPPAAKPPSLQDLGFTAEQTRGNLLDQASLDKRSRMLKMHQKLGLITLVPLLATVITSNNATREGTSSGRNLHAALGIVTAGLYLTTASFALRAPKLPGTETRGPIRLHKALAWIHGIGMILTPILGAMARAQLDRGERVHGIASAHSAVADVTIAAYAAAIGAVAIKF